MSQIPYESVAIEADRLIVKMVLATTWAQMDYYWDVYLVFLDACGWTDKEFDAETLKRIDATWSHIKKQR